MKSRPTVGRIYSNSEWTPKSKTIRRVFQTFVVVLGLVGSIGAFVSTPMKVDGGAQGVSPCDPILVDRVIDCVTDTETAVVRGVGVLVLAVAAFAGVTVIFKD